LFPSFCKRLNDEVYLGCLYRCAYADTAHQRKVQALQKAAIIARAPFSVIIFMMILSLFKMLKKAYAEEIRPRGGGEFVTPVAEKAGEVAIDSLNL
jgi:choline-glycine betaine transporter